MAKGQGGRKGPYDIVLPFISPAKGQSEPTLTAFTLLQAASPRLSKGILFVAIILPTFQDGMLVLVGHFVFPFPIPFVAAQYPLRTKKHKIKSFCRFTVFFCYWSTPTIWLLRSKNKKMVSGVCFPTPMVGEGKQFWWGGSCSILRKLKM